MSKETKIEIKSLTIEGRNAVLEAFRSGKPVDKLFVLDGCQDGPVRPDIHQGQITYLPVFPNGMPPALHFSPRSSVT